MGGACRTYGRVEKCLRYFGLEIWWDDSEISQQTVFHREQLLAPRLTLQAGVVPLVGAPRLLIQYIRSYPPYLEAVSSFRNPRTRHAVVTTHLTWSH